VSHDGAWRRHAPGAQIRRITRTRSGLLPRRTSGGLTSRGNCDVRDNPKSPHKRRRTQHHHVGDLKALPLDKVLERVTERIKSTIDKNYAPAIHLGEEWGKIERNTVEKRLTVSFTLLSLAHVKKPDGSELYPQLLERIPRVMGQYDFALACELFPSRILSMNEKVLERIKSDREGFEAPLTEKDVARFNDQLAAGAKKDPTGLEARLPPVDAKGLESLMKPKGDGSVRAKAFTDYYQEELQRIRFLQDDIFHAKKRLQDLQEQKARDEAFLKERQQQREDVLARIAKARAKTEKDAADLRLYQDELFRYQLELATSEAELDQSCESDILIAPMALCAARR